MTVVVGTAGHIDHGKTSLLRALTGIDADRLPEERARGMTIDVGYAHLALGDGTELDFVDVPGHDRLIGNMLVGAGEIDAALLVVAADDGPRAQTREHLELLDALGISIGLTVVTKIDAVEPQRVADTVGAVRELLAGTTLDRVPILAASSVTGEGLDPVRAALTEVRDRALAGLPAESGPGPARLAIDRVFAVRGRGTVVTGTLRGATVERGAILRVVPGHDGAAVRVREIQVHGRAVERAGPGRTALNVVPVGGDVPLDRGVVLTADPSVVASDRMLVVVRPAVADRTAVSVHLGTNRVPGTIAAAGRDPLDLDDGRRASVLRLDRPIAAAPGDRFVLRRPSPSETLAGGVVLDPLPPRGVARRRSTPERVARLAVAIDAEPAAWAAARLELHGFDAGTGQLAEDVAAELDEVLRAIVGERGSIPAAELTRLGAAALRRRIGGAPGLDRAVAGCIDRLVEVGALTRHGGTVTTPGAVPDAIGAELGAAMERLERLLAVVAPPALGAAAAAARCPPDGVRRLERDGRIVRLEDDLAWAASTYAQLTARAVELAGRAPLTPALLRDATGTSRKYVMAILEDLDRRAILRRTPEGHVPGPRAATAATATAPAAPVSARR